jgi:hypothetical protein
LDELEKGPWPSLRYAEIKREAAKKNEAADDLLGICWNDPMKTNRSLEAWRYRWL